MIRVVIIEILLFLLPFAVSAAYQVLVRKHPFSSALLKVMSVMKLAVIGLVLAIVGLILLAQFGGADRDGVYTPAIYKDGKIIPGHID